MNKVRVAGDTREGEIHEALIREPWRAVLVIVKPDTVIAWHRHGFRLFWTWKSRRRVGRPTVPLEVRTLIRTMSAANPLWGASPSTANC